MKPTVKHIEEIVSVLTEEEKLLLKDTIKHGEWGDSETCFLDENGNIEDSDTIGFCTNDAKLGGNFSGRKISVMFRSLYKKLCPANHNQIGRHISHCSDWWGDGSGDMLFIRSEYYNAFQGWAKN